MTAAEISRPHLRLTPDAFLLWDADAAENADTALPAVLRARLSAHFKKSVGEGLLVLAENSAEGDLPASLTFWRSFVREFLTRICHIPRLREDGWQGGPEAPNQATLVDLIQSAPPLPGMEYLRPDVLENLWGALNDAVSRRVAEAAGNVAEVMRNIHPVWRLVGRVTLHLAENKRSSEFPFAFLATYSHRLDAQARVQYLPLAQALRDSAASGDKAMLQTLLQPLHAASERSAFLRGLIDTKEIFGVLAWTPTEAHRFLREIPLFEESGLLVKVPDWWSAKKPPRPSVNITLDAGEKKASFSAQGLLKFDVRLAVGDVPLSEEEISYLLALDAPLVSLKGQWVEVDKEKLREALDHWQKAKAAHEAGIPFHQGLRWLAGISIESGATTAHDLSDAGAGWVNVLAGKNLRELLTKMRDPSSIFDAKGNIPGLQAELRPYQKTGVAWLKFLADLGLGPCLADDMGLGKTLQVIALLQSSRLAAKNARQPAQPSLLVAPASLIGNWQREIRKFAPDMPHLVAHRSALGAEDAARLSDGTHPALTQEGLIITTYTSLAKFNGLLKTNWDYAILDEAQAIKNAGSGQTRTVKSLTARVRLALTGTPVENRLGDLWSLFDFLNPGLLGSARQFAETAKRLSKRPSGYGPLRRLVQPYILRRMKTDPAVAPDLPAKTEMNAFCSLSKRQATLYQRIVNALRKELADTTGIQRQGVVLATLMKLKQVCNHPSLWSGDATFESSDSGKFQRLAEICAEIADRQEKVLIFTQFAEMTQPLAAHLTNIFGVPGLVLHGGTPIAKRQEFVERFQSPGGPPFFVISVKAGGTGLTLTAASHVVHFDRWWNPAVEDQATDRAFRIGQKKNVLVHKFVCQGTLEERIDELIQSKKKLAADILGPEDGAEKMLTQMSDQELLSFVELDATSL